MANKDSGWMIKGSIRVTTFRKELNEYIRFLKQKKSQLKNNKTKNRELKLIESQIEVAQNLLKNISTTGKNRLQSLFTVETSRIHKNIRTRFSRKFPSGAGQLESAINNSEFTKVIPFKDRLFYGAGNIDVLDEYTSIYIDSEGKEYEPPSDYDGADSWWKYWEFSGIDPQNNFRNVFTYRYVKSKGWLRNKRIRPRPFLLNKGALFSEDQKVFEKMPANIITKLIKESVK